VFRGQVAGGRLVNSEPVEIPDAEHEQIVERVAAIDVAKESGVLL
jgi:hypothetical protein